MIADRDPVIASRLLAGVSADDDSDWGDVLARARALAAPRRARRSSLAVVVVAAVVVCVVVAPAIAFHRQLAHLFSHGTPAPEQVRHDFASMDRGAPPGMAPHVLSRRARIVLRQPIGDGRSVVVWAAPTRAGGFCVLSGVAQGGRVLHGTGGGCDRDRSLRLAPGVSIPKVWRTVGGAIRVQGPVILTGDTLIRAAATVELIYRDGRHRSIPLRWVSSPIEAGFFAYSIPRGHWAHEHAPARLVVRDASGRVLLTDTSFFASGLIPMPPVSRGRRAEGR